MNNKKSKKVLHKVSSLVLLVILVFFILLISVIISGFISTLLVKINVFPPLSDNRLPIIFAFMLIVSLLIGTILAILGGDYFLRPLQQLTEATKEIATGNFDVYIKPHGSREMAILAESFNKMAKELASIENLRDDFVSNISHEYKTPMVSIRGFARQLKKKSLTQEQREKYIEIIISESDRLVNLSSNVLLLSKIENSSDFIAISKFSLDEQIRKVILILDSQIFKKNIMLKIDLKPIIITANEELLQHVWINILSNAIKFSPNSSEIKINLFSQDKMVVVTISDSGPGLSVDAKQHLFDKFYQEDSSRASEGNGLGLSLVKKIINISGGEINVSNNSDIGTTFIIKLQI